MYMESFDNTKENKKDLLTQILNHPLFLTLVGPFFLMLNLAGLVVCFSLPSLLFSIAAIVGYGFSWKYQIRGALYSFGLLGFSCAFLFLTESLPFSVAMTILFFLSFSSSYFLIGLTADACFSLEQESVKENEKKMVSLQTSYETNLKYLENQLDEQIDHGKSLDKALKIQDKEILSLRQLIKMSHLESEKYKQESLEYKTLIENYHQTLVSYEEKEEEATLLKQRAKQLVNNLNQERVDAYQQKLILEDYQKQVKGIEKSSFLNFQSSSEELYHLQQERAKIKQCYHEQLREYQGFARRLESLYEQAELGVLIEDQQYKETLLSLENQAKLLQDLRLDVLKIEESILHLRKELKLSCDDGLTPGSYLAIADQECVRLEEENALLLKLVLNLCMKPLAKEELAVNLESQDL